MQNVTRKSHLVLPQTLKSFPAQVVGNVSGKWKRIEIMFKNMVKFIVQDPPNAFFGKCFKKSTEYFLKFVFLFESAILPVNNGK